MAGINAEAEQREQLIAETEQRIADLKQQIEKARDILVVHQWLAGQTFSCKGR